MILGIEHVSCAAMQPLLQGAIDHPAHNRALQLQSKCTAAGSDGLVFINGFSERSSDDFLIDLADDLDAESLSIAGIDIEFAEIFSRSRGNARSARSRALYRSHPGQQR